jgi:sulfur-oxidizing protein SoxY
MRWGRAIGGHRASLAFVGALALGVIGSAAIAEDLQPSGSAWEFLRSKYYGDKTMGLVDETYMSLEVPGNTPDPAATPLTLRFADEPRRRIKRVRVFVDNNPAPLVATLEFSQTPITEIDLHVRVDRFTSVRAVAEIANGDLEMRSAWVKASGGCSAPPTDSSQGGTLGQIKLRPAADGRAILISIRHPNSSGFQIDPRTGDPIPAHYISHVRIEAGGAPLLDADTGISVSENPTFRIALGRPVALPVSVDAIDSATQAHYTGSTETFMRSAAAATPDSAMNVGDH